MGVAELVELLLELREVEVAEVREVEDTTDEVEDPEEVDDETTVELDEVADLFCTIANVVPTKVALLLASIAL